MKEYKDMPFPWTSKSKIGDLDYCEYTFYRSRILKDRPQSREDALEGTNMHTVFASFFQIFSKMMHENPNQIFIDKYTDPRIKTESHPFRRFIYEACLERVKPEHREYDKYKNILRNFATIECKRWLRLNTLLTNREEIVDCFLPLYVEKHLEVPAIHMFGTIDRINVEVMPDLTKKVVIYDYKTGNVPKSIRDHVDTGEMFDWSIPSHYMKEVHFYGLLYLLSTGWELSPEIIKFLENEEWWYTKTDTNSKKEVMKEKKTYITGLNKKYKPFKGSKTLGKGDILVGIYFLNGTDGFKPMKEFGFPSYKSVLESINYYRSVMHSEDFIKHPKYVFNEYGCTARKCGRINECKQLMGINE